ERSGVPVLPVIAAGVAGARDGVLVIQADAELLDRVAPAEVTDELLDRLWTAVSAMHESGIAHGALDALHLVLAADGSPRIGDFEEGVASATPQAVLTDRAQLLVTTALVAGDERAVAAALRAIGTDGLTEVLSYVQPA